VRRADDLVQRFLDSIGQSEGSAYVGLFRSWQAIVGERIAAHAQPVDVKGHSLVVEADHPGWVQMVMMRRGRIIDELERRFPQLRITGLAVRVVDRPGAARPGRDRPDETIRTTRPDDVDRPATGSGTRTAATGGWVDEGAPREDDPSDAPVAPPAPSRDESEALERIDDDDLRDALARLRVDLDERND